jgi:predicted Zn-dependent peptidase
MSRRLALALIAITGCGGSAKFADLELGPRRAAFTEEIYATTLANGLRVVLVPDARTNLVTVGVHYEVGSADDPVHDAGLAHYVEHVVFDAAFRGAGGDALRDVALEQNAMTQLDRTYFYASGLDGDLDRLLDAAARRFEATCEDLDAAVLARERDVVLEEVKYRSRYDTSFGAMLAAIWGGSHPYARYPGAAEFADISRARLCEFIDRHYGPASAVLAVTGHVAEADLRRIRARFEAIPARPRPASPAPSTLPTGTARVSIAGLEQPTAMIVFPVPGEGGDADGIVGLLDGMSWWLPGAAPSRSMSLFVIGERRARAVVAFAETEDAARLDELAQAMRGMLARLPIAGFEERKERARIAAAADLDDVLGA